MPKRIILFADGTGNSSSSITKTNVWRLYQALNLRPRSGIPPDLNQVAYFRDGVGTSDFAPLRMLGLALGIGLRANILSLYRYLAMHFVKGDSVYLFGFSRGAYTALLLCEFINEVGLIDGRGLTEEQLKTESDRKYREFRKEVMPLPWIGSLLSLPFRILSFLWSLMTSSSSQNLTFHSSGADSKKISFEFVGLWDAVGAYGIPIQELRTAIHRWVYPIDFKPEKALTEEGFLTINWLRHALSLDDERKTFHPVVLKESHSNLNKDNMDERQIVQLWFAGVHANVGGGYPDDGLSYIPLLWMIHEAQKRYLSFEDSILQSYEALASAAAPLYDSRQGVGFLYRLMPRNAFEMSNLGSPMVHESVITRLENKYDRYAPLALLQDPVERTTPNPYAYLTQSSHSPQHNEIYTVKEINDKHSLIAIKYKKEKQTQQDNKNIIKKANLTHSIVWWRRVNYIASIIAILLLISIGLAPESLTDLLCAKDSMMWILISTSLYNIMDTILPDELSFFSEAWGTLPIISILLGVIIFYFVKSNETLKKDTNDIAESIWNQRELDLSVILRRSAIRATLTSIFIAIYTLLSGSLYPILIGGATLAVSIIFLILRWNSNIERLFLISSWIRSHPCSQRIAYHFSHFFLPLVLIALIILGPLVIFLHVLLADRLSLSCDATPNEQQMIIGPTPQSSTFAINSTCMSTKWILTSGKSYRVSMEISPSDKANPNGLWKDGHTTQSDLMGFTPLQSYKQSIEWACSPDKKEKCSEVSSPVPNGTFIHYLSQPLKRMSGVNWLRPILHIQKSFQPQRFAFTPKNTAQSDRGSPRLNGIPSTLSAEMDFTATQSGELFLYVNDVLIPWIPALHKEIWGNNHGTANVTIQEITPQSVPAKN